MPRKSLLWQLFPTYLLLVLFVLLAATWYNARSLHDFYRNRTVADLQNQAVLLQPQILPALANQQYQAVDRVCKQIGNRVPSRISVILPSGQVVGDSEEDPRQMDNHADRDEVQQALSGTVGVSTRYSHTQQRNMLYVAMPLRQHADTLGILRMSIPLVSMGRLLRQIDVHLLLGGFIIALLAVGISFVVSQRITRPLVGLREGALRFAQGDLSKKLVVPDSDEIGNLADAMNTMAAQLDERFKTILQQRNEQEAILASMAEGVLAVDTDERVISMNNAAARMLQVNPERAQGRSMQEVIRHATLHQFIVRALAGSQPVDSDIVIRDGSERLLQADGALLRDAQQKAIGVVVVLNDITRLRRLENMRREFVANVSHELRTPITSIKGFIEALQDGALDDREDALHFLQVIARQADRLSGIIEDLLTLSTLDQGTEDASITLEETSLANVINSAVQVCSIKASEKHITVVLEGMLDETARINPPLLEQAVVNLIDNAIKYSDPASHVRISVARGEDDAVINVADTGCGIAAEHLPRLFERFYRVDKARSRKLGGTGLGLSIVKHIAQAHGGYVSVASTPGKGSVFSIHLPQPGV